MTRTPAEWCDLGGTRAIVVGASQGIGAAVALGLAAAGSGVLVAGRSKERLEDIRERAAEAGSTLTCAEVDVRSPESVRTFCAETLGHWGTPTILVNSAGFALTKSSFDVEVDEWDAVHEVHLRGTFLTCQAFGRAMAEVRYGKIINLSSTWAATVGRGRSVYCAAKAGVSHLTSALAVEWAPLGIRVNALAPAATVTPTMQERLEVDPEREAYLRGNIPLGRLAAPEDLVGAALFLASPASDFVTGETLFVDGGFRTAK